MSSDLSQRLRALRDVDLDDDRERYRIAELIPEYVCQPRDLAAVAQCVAAVPPEKAILPIGCGTQLGSHGPPSRYDVAISTRRMNRILAHEAADLTVKVEAGVTIAELNEKLAQDGQHLPLDPPHPGSATVGAIIAADAWGPLRYAHGKVRDLLIGVSVVLADGTVVKGGGQVVKNVAGYDLMKLFAGSQGTLGIIAEASFKLRPLSDCSATVILPCSHFAAALEQGLRLRDAAIEPQFLLAVDQSAGRLCGIRQPSVVIGFSGAEQEVAAQLEIVGAERESDAATVYASLRDFPCTTAGWSARISTLPSQLSAIHSALAGPANDVDIATIAEIGSGTLWLRYDPSAPAAAFTSRLRNLLEEHSAFVTFTSVPRDSAGRIDRHGNLPAAGLQLRIKRELDPLDRLSPGRFPGSVTSQSR